MGCVGFGSELTVQALRGRGPSRRRRSSVARQGVRRVSCSGCVLGARAILVRHVMAQRAAALLGELNASKAASQEHAKERSGAEAEARTLRAQLDVRTAEAAAEIERLKRQCCDQSSQARTKKQTNKCLVQCTRRAATSATRCNDARPAGNVRTAHNAIRCTPSTTRSWATCGTSCSASAPKRRRRTGRHAPPGQARARLPRVAGAGRAMTGLMDSQDQSR